jgi:hypothetical protein
VSTDQPVVLAGDITDWIDEKSAWLDTTLPFLFLIAVVAIGLWMLIVTKGMIRKLIVFGLGAAIVYMILTNIPALADKFGTETSTTTGGSAPLPRGSVVVVDGLR